MEFPAALLWKPDSTQRAVAARFNQPSNDRENFRQWRSPENQFQKVEYRFSGKQA